MKANEAPEKIYLTTFGFPICEPIPQESSNPDTVWSEKPYEGADSIEYTRTDAFIEKAEEFIYSALNDGIMGTANIEAFMRLFEKYMKGE